MAPTLVVRVAGNLEEFRKNLREATGSIETTKASLEKLSKSFQGEKLIQTAHNVTAAIQKTGVAVLNTSEGARSLDLLDKAMDKLLRTGQQVPLEMSKTAAELRRMGRATEEADKTVLSISQNYRQFDGVLQSLGVNIGPYVKGLEDITTLVGKGATGLGLMGAAAAAVGTAIAAWKIGEHIGQVTGWTEAIARGTAAMRGYGDVFQETAGARADAVDLAWKYEENLKRQAKSIEETTKATVDHSEETRRNWSITEGNAGALLSLQGQLDALAKKRKDDAIAAFKASQAESIFGDEIKDTTAALGEQIDALDAREESLKKTAAAEAARKKAVSDFMTAPTLNDRVNAPQSFDLAPLTKSQLTAMGTKPGGQFDEKNLRDKLTWLEDREGTIKPKNNKDFFALQRDSILLAQLRMYFDGIGRPETLEGFAGGVKNFRGGRAVVGERGPEIVNLPSGSDVIPNHALGGNVTIAPVIHVHGHTLSSAAQLRDLIASSLLDVMRSGGIPLPRSV